MPVLTSLGTDSLEVIVVDDGSNDDTGRKAAALYGQLPRSLVVRQEHNFGKGAAVRLGFTVATGAKVVVCDADMAIDPEQIPAMLQALDRAPIVFGSRTVNGAIRYDSFARTQSGVLFNRLVRHYVPTELRDTQCGFKGFHVATARLLGSLGLIRGFAYDVEMIFLANQLELSIAQLQVTWRDVEGSSVRLVRDSRQMVRDIRSLRRGTYECPSVRIGGEVDVEIVQQTARSVRQAGLVVARGVDDDLVVLPRDGALSALEIAKVTGGTVGIVKTSQLRDRILITV